MNKPPVLSDKELGDLIDLESEYQYPCSDGSEIITFDCRPIAQAQRDADYKHEQDTAREIFEEIERYEEFHCDTDVEFFMSVKQWQSLKDKYLSPKE